MEKSFQEKDRKVQVIESLLQKPSKKPDFTQFKESDILKKAAAFIPQFISTTDRLLSDPDFLRKHQMDIDVKDQNNITQEEKENEAQQESIINMDIGVGVYDILNADFNSNNFIPSSTEPIIQVKGLKQENINSSQSSSSDDEDCYYEFNSSDEDAASHTTKSTQQNRKPIIQDITPQQSQTQKKTLQVNKKKRKRKV